LQLERAPEPSLILWENLQYSTTERVRRKFTTTFLAASLILISVILAFVARYYQEQNLTTDSSCPDNWASMTAAAQQSLAQKNSNYLGCFCRDKNFVTQVNHPVCKVSPISVTMADVTLLSFVRLLPVARCDARC
jgi:hypothetical protein